MQRVLISDLKYLFCRELVGARQSISEMQQQHVALQRAMLSSRPSSAAPCAATTSLPTCQSTAAPVVTSAEDALEKPGPVGAGAVAALAPGFDVFAGAAVAEQLAGGIPAQSSGKAQSQAEADAAASRKAKEDQAAEQQRRQEQEKAAATAAAERAAAQRAAEEARQQVAAERALQEQAAAQLAQEQAAEKAQRAAEDAQKEEEARRAAEKAKEEAETCQAAEKAQHSDATQADLPHTATVVVSDATEQPITDNINEADEVSTLPDAGAVLRSQGAATGSTGALFHYKVTPSLLNKSATRVFTSALHDSRESMQQKPRLRRKHSCLRSRRCTCGCSTTTKA